MINQKNNIVKLNQIRGSDDKISQKYLDTIFLLILDNVTEIVNWFIEYTELIIIKKDLNSSSKKIINKDLKKLSNVFFKVKNYIVLYKFNNIDDIIKLKNFIYNSFKNFDFFSKALSEIIDNIDSYINVFYLIDNKTDLLINEWKDELNINIKDLIKNIKTSVSNTLSWYFFIFWEISLLRKKLNEKEDELEKNKKIILKMDKDLKSLDSFINKLNITHEEERIKRINLESYFERLKKEKENQDLFVINLSKEIEKLKKEIEEKNKNVDLTQIWNSNNNESKKQEYEEYIWLLELESINLKNEISVLKSELSKSNLKLLSIESKKQNLETSYIDKFLLNCENNLENLSIDDLLKYITFSDCNISIKQEAINIILNYLNLFLQKVCKWNSSSTNTNIWIAWWKYSNNFINPIINFIKDKYEWMSVQRYLEFLIWINWKKLIREYKPDENYTSKRDKVIENVYVNIEDDKEFWVIESLSYINLVLSWLEMWNVDLSLLNTNIWEYISNWDSTRRELKKISEKIISLK